MDCLLTFMFNFFAQNSFLDIGDQTTMTQIIIHYTINKVYVKRLGVQFKHSIGSRDNNSFDSDFLS